MQPSASSGSTSSSEQDLLDVGAVVRGEKQNERTAQYTFSEIPSETPFRCTWHVERRAGGLAVEGHLAGDLLLICDECNESFIMPIALGIDELFVLSQYADGNQGREKELHSDDFYEVVDAKGKIDLRDLAYQFLVMESNNHTVCHQPPCPSAEA